MGTVAQRFGRVGDHRRVGPVAARRGSTVTTVRPHGQLVGGQPGLLVRFADGGLLDGLVAVAGAAGQAPRTALMAPRRPVLEQHRGACRPGAARAAAVPPRRACPRSARRRPTTPNRPRRHARVQDRERRDRRRSSHGCRAIVPRVPPPALRIPYTVEDVEKEPESRGPRTGDCGVGAPFDRAAGVAVADHTSAPTLVVPLDHARAHPDDRRRARRAGDRVRVRHVDHHQRPPAGADHRARPHRAAGLRRGSALHDAVGRRRRRRDGVHRGRRTARRAAALRAGHHRRGRRGDPRVQRAHRRRDGASCSAGSTPSSRSTRAWSRPPAPTTARATRSARRTCPRRRR